MRGRWEIFHVLLRNVININNSGFFLGIIYFGFFYFVVIVQWLSHV